MPKYLFKIPGHEDQEIVWFTRKHIMSLLGSILLIIFLFLIPVAFGIVLWYKANSIFESNLLNVVVILAAVYYLVIISFTFTIWINYYYDVFIITDQEIIDIKQEGIFGRKINEVSILRIQDVSAQVKGVLPTLFNYGNVVAESAGENSQTYIIEDVPNPMKMANKIMTMHNEQVAREDRAFEIITAEGDLRKNSANGQTQSTASFGEMNNGSTQTYCPPCPPSNPVSGPESPSNSEGNVSKKDLDKGGEVKF